MRFDKNNIGVYLAVLAGFIAFGIALWPFGAPQTPTQAGQVWLLVPFGAAVAFLAAAFLADRSATTSRILLIVGALALFASGVFSSGLIEGQGTTLAVTLDIVPGLVALVAAFLIGPMRTRPGTV